MGAANFRLFIEWEYRKLINIRRILRLPNREGRVVLYRKGEFAGVREEACREATDFKHIREG